MKKFVVESLLKNFYKDFGEFLKDKLSKKEISQEETLLIRKNVMKNLEKWLKSPFVPSYIKEGIAFAMRKKRISEIVDAFWRDITFGTGGIRGKVVYSKKEFNEVMKLGKKAKFLQGPNTVNEVTIKIVSQAIANYLKEKKKKPKVVIGYDTRILGRFFAKSMAQVFLSNGIGVVIFRKPNPVPQLSFAIRKLKADLGIQITASHNDKRYNGIKVNDTLGAAIDLKERRKILKFIVGKNKIWLSDVLCRKRKELKLVSKSLDKEYFNYLRRFILKKKLVKEKGKLLKLGYAALHGSGAFVIPKLFRTLGFRSLLVHKALNKTDAAFPSFEINQPIDPALPKIANIVVKNFKKEFGKKVKEIDGIITTDPDADRMAMIIKLPKYEAKYFGEWRVLRANEIWPLLLWYRLSFRRKKSKKEFIVKTHVTTELLRKMSERFGIKCYDTFVGFSFLAEKVKELWRKGYVNIGCFEHSNGFTIAGSPSRGHILDKDGTLAAILVAEVALYAKLNFGNLIALQNKIYKSFGYYETNEFQLPEEGIFEGASDELTKIKIIKNLEDLFRRFKRRENIYIAGMKVVKALKLASGRYDFIYWEGFPDEGIKFYLENTENYVSVRPSGTEPKIRIYVQLKETLDGSEREIAKKKFETMKKVEKIREEIAELIS